MGLSEVIAVQGDNFTQLCWCAGQCVSMVWEELKYLQLCFVLHKEKWQIPPFSDHQMHEI